MCETLPRTVLVMALPWLVMFAGCTAPMTTGQVEAVPEIIVSSKRYRKDYLLGAGDTVEVVVMRHAEVSRRVAIRPDGFISLPLLDDVKAGGLTVSELDAELTKQFAERLKDPEVTVIAVSMRPPMVYVLGEVGQQQAIELRDARTAAQAIAKSGGFLKSARTSSVALIRLMEDGHIRAIKVPVNLDGQPAPYMALANIPLRADDLIFVPEAGITQFSRWMENWVNTPLAGFNSVANTVLVPYSIVLLQQQGL